MNRHISRALMAATAAAALILSACSPADTDTATSGTEPDNANAVTLGLTYVPNVQFAPVYMAEDKGLYAEAGADITVRHHGAEEGLFTALASGEEDIVLASGDEVLQARDAGMDLVSVGTYYHTHPVTFIVREDSGIAVAADLKGKKVGVPGEYGSNWYALLAYLAAYDMTVDDIEVVSIGYTQTAALAQGEVDMVVGFRNNEMVQMGNAGIYVREMHFMPTLIPLVGASLVTTREFAAEHPELVRAVVAGTTAGIEALHYDMDEALTATQQRDPGLTGDALVTASYIRNATMLLWADDEGRFTMEQDLTQWRRMADFLATVPGLLNNPVDLDAAVTNDFVN